MDIKKSGAALMAAVGFLGLLTVLTSAFVANIGIAWSRMERGQLQAKAFWVAEAGIQKALLEIEESHGSYAGEEFLFGEGKCIISVKKNQDDDFTIFSTGKVGHQDMKKTIAARISVKCNDNGKFTTKVVRWLDCGGNDFEKAIIQ